MLESDQLTRSDRPGRAVEIIDRASGSLKVKLPFTGEVDNPMDLKGFPFDEDSLDFRFAGTRLLDGRQTKTDYILRPKNGDKFVKFYFDTHLPEFELLGVSYVVYRRRQASKITVGISMRRKHQYPPP